MKHFMTACMIIALFAAADFASAASYVGSEQCFSCHKDQFNDWQASGHPWKLRKMEKARSSGLPLPQGYSWDDISYVIGGANKKARFIDLEGFIITAAKDGSEAKTQYNLADGSWSFYHKGEKKPYKCGPCHMTAYSPDGNQDGRPGMIGTWMEDGIGCEECHGPGSDHIQKPSKTTITITSSTQACAKCHQRGGINPRPPASGGFIKHHEQGNEILAGPHRDLSCMDCHDPHQRAVLTKNTCENCHAEQAASYAKTIHAKGDVKCLDCHMPKATKSAIKINKFTGDVRTHIFKINTDPKASMFETVVKDGKESTFAKPFVTLDYVCLGCHIGRDINWAADNHNKGAHH
nr:hypothetical protein [Desulfobulbaceae bacterium]